MTELYGLWYPRYQMFLSLSGLAYASPSPMEIEVVAGKLMRELGLQIRRVPHRLLTRPAQEMVNGQGPRGRDPAIGARCTMVDSAFGRA